MKKLLGTFALAGLIGMVGCETQDDDVILDEPVFEEPTTAPPVTEPVAPPLSPDTAIVDTAPAMQDMEMDDNVTPPADEPM